MVLGLEGSEVEDHGDHLVVVRSPSEPGSWWGNLVLLGDEPAARRRHDWDQVVTTCHPGEMRSGLGFVTDGSGVARFRSLDTGPDSRGQGLAATLVHHAATDGFEVLHATRLVIVADPADAAFSVYRSVGFATAEKTAEQQATLARAA